MRIMLLFLLLVSCQTFKCEDSKTPASCEIAKSKARAEREMRQAENKTMVCTGSSRRHMECRPRKIIIVDQPGGLRR